jgi:hypothetical protein
VPNALHRLLAAVPALVGGETGPHRPLLLVTTNYDDALEMAFRDAGEPFDLVVYKTGENEPGYFARVLADGTYERIEDPNSCAEVNPETRSVILKLHGTVDRRQEAEDSYVITEDDYIEYLMHESLSAFVPVHVLRHLLRSHFLFLGYGLRDWNLRVFLHRLWRERSRHYNSWAVQLHTNALDERFWQERKVELYAANLSAYVTMLRAALEDQGEGTAAA